MNKISVIFMAAGLSERFGRNKLIEIINNKFLFQHSLDLILEIKFDEIIIISNTLEIIQYAKKNNLPVYENKNAMLGQGTTIKIGMMHAKKENDYMFITADMPNLTKDAILEIIKSFNTNNTITIPRIKNKTYNPVIYPNKYKEKLQNIKNEKTGKSIIESNDIITYVDFDNIIFFKDIDYIEDIT